MSEHAQELRDAFAAHEYLAPDAADVYAGALARARVHRRRQWATRSVGGAVVGAGLVAGGVGVAGLLPTDPQTAALPAAGAAPASQPTASPSASPSHLVLPSPIASIDYSSPDTATQREWNAYFGAGYGYDNALELAGLWHMSAAEPGAVKAEAGRRLLAGETLPVAARPDAVPTESAGDGAVAAFFNAGYTYDDAVRIAVLWHTTDVYQVKMDAGQMLLDGKKLPIAP